MPAPLTHGDHSCKAASAGGEHVNWNKVKEKMGGKSGRWEESRIMLNSDAGRQKQSGGNRMLTDRACWNIHHPVLLVLPSYLPFQSVLCPPVSHPLGQPDPLQLSRGLCLPGQGFFLPPSPWLAGWLIPCLDLPSSPSPTPLPLSAVCKEEKGDVCNRTLIPVSYAVENCWWCCWQRESFGSTPDLSDASARHYQEVHWPASPPMGRWSVYVRLTIYDLLFYTPRAHAHFLNQYDSH